VVVIQQKCILTVNKSAAIAHVQSSKSQVSISKPMNALP